MEEKSSVAPSILSSLLLYSTQLFAVTYWSIRVVYSAVSTLFIKWKVINMACGVGPFGGIVIVMCFGRHWTQKSEEGRDRNE
mmetsp:Transcript_30839/g.45972  ORF Transcript_30839/g.45972 Transcript_30839/m.45972 type:complete len:82 (-) Transcript_30839:1563-1808(-)